MVCSGNRIYNQYKFRRLPLVGSIYQLFLNSAVFRTACFAWEVETLPSILFFTSAGISLTIAVFMGVYAWNHRQIPGAFSFAGIFACITIWSIAYLLTLHSTDLAGKYFWMRFGYLGSAFMAFVWLIFTLDYVGHADWLTKKRFALLAFIPVVTVALAFTNNLHGLIWSRVWLEENVRVSHGLWYYVFIAYSYSLFFAGSSLLVWKFYRLKAPFTYQVGAIYLGSVLVILWSVYYLASPSLLIPLEYTPVIINLSGLCYAVGLFRFHLLDINPISSEIVVDSMRDGLLIVDGLGRIVEMNHTAEEIFASPFSNCIGRPVDGLISNWTQNIDANPEPTVHETELALQKNGQTRIYALRTSPIKISRGAAGRMAFLTDVTERKRIEAAAKEQRALAEALRDSAAALNSTLQLDEVLDRILINIGRVLPYDSVDVLLIEDRIARVVRSQRTTLPDQANPQYMAEIYLDSIPDFHKMYTTGKPIVTPDVSKKADWIPLQDTAWIRSVVGTPIQVKGQVIGFLNVNSSVAGFYTEAYADRLQAFADQAAIAIENARLFREREQQALTDSLSGLYNRRALFDIGQREVERSLRLNHPLSVIMMDIDHFKAVNDTYGHMVGDDVIRALVKILNANVRSIDLIGRLGGDEFTIILLEDGLTDSCRIAERIRRSVENSQLKVDEGSIQFTISLGVAELNGEAGNLLDLISVADHALYTAKMNGRNQVFAANQIRVDLPEQIL
jgi:diguanylate cyclase (GGDEF)-like protein/PAS domain S-box-containing protein